MTTSVGIARDPVNGMRIGLDFSGRPDQTAAVLVTYKDGVINFRQIPVEELHRLPNCGNQYTGGQEF